MEENLGMTPMDVLLAATQTAAEACAVEDITGTITLCKMVDLIIVEKNPLNDLSILEEREAIKLVMKEGIIEVNRQ